MKQEQLNVLLEAIALTTNQDAAAKIRALKRSVVMCPDCDEPCEHDGWCKACQKGYDECPVEGL